MKQDPTANSVLYRVFPRLENVGHLDEGGPLFVARSHQGTGRHDNPAAFGALYATAVPESAIAELLRGFIGRTVTNLHFQRPDGRRYALASIDESALGPLVDLDDPNELVRLRLKPSQVATRKRSATQPIAFRIFEAGAIGLSWWSGIEASWPNVTLFAERSVDRLVVKGEPEVLSVDHATVVAVADFFGIRLGV
jgi:RES domain-containing protein